MTVSLTNKGLIPIEAVTTMGVSAKEGENPIGVFGTGLKYAIASLLRTSQKITVWCGLDRYDFTTSTSKVRGKDFDFIHMKAPDGDHRLGFTTHLGAHWEMWQVFRELYSNCLDEEGEMEFARIEPKEGQTTIWVDGVAFENAAREKNEVFLSTKPLHKGTLADIHPGAASGIYYRGVLVSKLSQPSLHTYNITYTMALTEDRTLRDVHGAHSYISHTLENCTDLGIIVPALLSEGRLEGGLAYSSPCEGFAESVLDLCERKGRCAVLSQAVRSAESWAQREARVNALQLSDIEEEEVSEAIAFLASIGYPISAPIVVAETLGADVYGMARNDTIYLARITINRGGNFLIGTILEEHLHLSQGFEDESRRFQDFLIDLVVKFARDSVRQRALRQVA